VARHRVALIDELAAQKYQRPSLQRLIDAGDHAIDRPHVRELASVGYQLCGRCPDPSA
jgi:hypothetical protein